MVFAIFGEHELSTKYQLKLGTGCLKPVFSGYYTVLHRSRIMIPKASAETVVAQQLPSLQPWDLSCLPQNRHTHN